MDSARVDIVYRPLRIAWVIESNSFDSFRKVVRLSHTVWGGTFNPIVFADRPEEANDIIKVFRADILMPLVDSPQVTQFCNSRKHLLRPFYLKDLFSGGGEAARATLLDIENMLVFGSQKRFLEDFAKAEFRNFVWETDDPLADLFSIQFGTYPAKKDCPIDYRSIFVKSLRSSEYTIDKSGPLSGQIYKHPSISYLSRHGLRRHHSIRSGWDNPGFFVGDVASLDDLVTYWNLCATDCNIQFIDQSNFDRFENMIPVFEKWALQGIAHRKEHLQQIAVWSREENAKDAQKLFSKRPHTLCNVSGSSWNGLNIQAPMMIFGEASTLGVVGASTGRHRLSFALTDKPFSNDNYFHNQQLIASVLPIGASGLGERHLFVPPYVPELNQDLYRSLRGLQELRIEPDRLGIVIGATENDSFLNSITSEEFFVSLFKNVGVTAKPSSAGFLARQLITQLGGLQGGRVFKIPGVRRLIKEHGPTDSFTNNVALQKIGKNDPDRPHVKFSDHQRLFIEAREEPLLTQQMVFTYLVENGLFRMGADLLCPSCSLKGWVPIDSLKMKSSCEYCGAEFDATRQLVADRWHYRRSGLLGRERNVHGAIPVALTLQQLDANLHGIGGANLYVTSYELEGFGSTEFEKCEVDFLVLSRVRKEIELIIGECKDGGQIIDANDTGNAKRVGDLFAKTGFKIYYLFSKVGSFTEDEIALTKKLNDEYSNRTILLSADELESYYFYERSTDEVAKKSYGFSAEILANVTSHLYFK